MVIKMTVKQDFERDVVVTFIGVTKHFKDSMEDSLARNQCLWNSDESTTRARWDMEIIAESAHITSYPSHTQMTIVFDNKSADVTVNMKNILECSVESAVHSSMAQGRHKIKRK